MLSPITIRYPIRPVHRSLAVGQVVDLFGLDEFAGEHLVAENLQLDVRAGDLVLFTGPSGSGKSSILRAVAQQLGALNMHALALPDRPLIEALDGPVESRLAMLSSCGLSEARLLLRLPGELSEGQQERFRLAYALQQVTAGGHAFLMVDEFAAVLDRCLAQVLAFQVRKRVSQTGVGMLCATTHEDIVDDLNPDLWVRCRGDGKIEVERRDVKKKRLVSRMSCGCQMAPEPTGRISRGGIIAATTSPSCAR